METKINSKALKAEALRLGFSACGIAPAEPIDQAHQNALKMWLDADRQAGMTYMANHFDKRCDPAITPPPVYLTRNINSRGTLTGRTITISCVKNWLPCSALYKNQTYRS